jgi:hypothetical protein
MFRPNFARFRVLWFLPVLAVLALPISSQILARAEFQRYHRAALDEILRRENLDRETMERVRKTLEPRRISTNGHWDGDGAANRLTRALKRGDFGLKRDHNVFELDGMPISVDLQNHLSRAMSLEFVGSLSSVIRRMRILDQLGSGGSSVIEPDRLDTYLKNTMNVTDHEQVAKSFDSNLTIEVKTLQEPTTLWRIYGGGSGPVGRYYFCCLLPNVADDAQLWIDGSGLATPRENLRQHLAGVTVPAGTTVLVGTVADNFADKFGHLEKGGNTQIFIPHVHGFPFDDYRKAAESTFEPTPKANRRKPPVPPSQFISKDSLRSEIVVQSDDRILRFQAADALRFPQ